jgi:hypothetical protein
MNHHLSSLEGWLILYFFKKQQSNTQTKTKKFGKNKKSAWCSQFT